MNSPNTEIEYALRRLLAGDLVAIPTETVYGLAADARNPSALAKIYAVKGRPSHNPLIIHLPSLDAIADWAIEIPHIALELAHAFWPGPLTLILKRHPNVSNIITADQETVAVRVPNHPLTLQLLKQFNGGLAAPSANRSGKISPTQADHVKADLGDTVGYILDGGPCQVGIESTILSFANDTIQILRQGSITQSQIEAVLGTSLQSQSAQLKRCHSERAYNLEIFHPGQSSSHYAPEKPLILLEASDFISRAHHMMQSTTKENVSHLFAVLSFSEQPHDFKGYWITTASDPEIYAQTLYHHLRILDQTPCQQIIVECPPNTESYFAVRDRLQRASAPLNGKPS